MESPTPSALPQPQQRRSRKTLQRILDAFEGLLGEKTFEEITVQEICTRASCSIGTFYGRVESKERLLDRLRERVYAEAEAELSELFDPKRASDVALPRLLAEHARALVALHVARRGVIRALIVQARRRAEFATYTRQFNHDMLRRVADTWLARDHEIAADDPVFAAEQAALMAAGYLREAVIFGDLWPSRTTRDPTDAPAEHARTLCRMLTGFLTTPRPSCTDSEELVS